jgi:hypothetical protein
LHPRFQRSAQVEIAPLDDELILFDPPSNVFLIMNAAGSFLWGRLSEPQTADDLARAVCGHFSGIELANAVHDVNDILEQMLSHKLVTRSEPSIHLEGGVPS